MAITDTEAVDRLAGKLRIEEGGECQGADFVAEASKIIGETGRDLSDIPIPDGCTGWVEDGRIVHDSESCPVHEAGDPTP